MVGGIIEDIIIVKDTGILSLLVRGMGDEQNDHAAINVKAGDHEIKVGDTIWWHGRRAIWKGSERTAREWTLPKIGFSYSGQMFAIMKRQALPIDPAPQ